MISQLYFQKAIIFRQILLILAMVPYDSADNSHKYNFPYHVLLQ